MTDAEKKLHELWAWCKDQPGYELERGKVKGLLGAIQQALIQKQTEDRGQNNETTCTCTEQCQEMGR